MKVTQLDSVLTGLLSQDKLSRLQEIIEIFSYKSSKVWFEKNRQEQAEGIDHPSKFAQMKNKHRRDLAEYLMGIEVESIRLEIIDALIVNGKEDLVLVCIDVLGDKLEQGIVKAIEKSFSKMSGPAQKACMQYLQDHGGAQGYTFLKKVAAKNGKLGSLINKSIENVRAQNDVIAFIERLISHESEVDASLETEAETLVSYLKDYFTLEQRITALTKLGEVSPEMYRKTHSLLLAGFEGQPSSPIKKEYHEDGILLLVLGGSLASELKETLIRVFLGGTHEKSLIFVRLSEEYQDKIVKLALEGTQSQKQWILQHFLNAGGQIPERVIDTIRGLITDDSLLIAAVAATLLLNKSLQGEKRRLQAIIAAYLAQVPGRENTKQIIGFYLDSLPTDLTHTIDMLPLELQEKAFSYLKDSPLKERILELILAGEEALTLEKAQWLATYIDLKEWDNNLKPIFVRKLLTSLSLKELSNFLADKEKLKPTVQRELVQLAITQGLNRDLDLSLEQVMTSQYPVEYAETSRLTSNLLDIIKKQLESTLSSQTDEASFIEAYQNQAMVETLLQLILTQSLNGLRISKATYLNRVSSTFREYKEKTQHFMTNVMDEALASLQSEDDESYIMLEGYVEELEEILNDIQEIDFLAGDSSVPEFHIPSKVEHIPATYRSLHLELGFIEDKIKKFDVNLVMYFITSLGHTVEKIQMLITGNEALLSTKLPLLLLDWLKQIGIEPIVSALGSYVPYDPQCHRGSGSEQMSDEVFVLTSGLKTSTGTIIRPVLINKK